MKAEKANKFEPIIITLETQEEFDVFYQLGNNSSIIESKLDTKELYVDEILTKLWEKLRELK